MAMWVQDEVIKGCSSRGDDAQMALCKQVKALRGYQGGAKVKKSKKRWYRAAATWGRW